MLTGILIASSMLFCVTNAQQGFDMDDEDFAAYIRAHDSVRQEYGESFARGCVEGGVAGSFSGNFFSVCIGCAGAGAGRVVEQMVFPEVPKRD